MNIAEELRSIASHYEDSKDIDTVLTSMKQLSENITTERKERINKYITEYVHEVCFNPCPTYKTLFEKIRKAHFQIQDIDHTWIHIAEFRDESSGHYYILLAVALTFATKDVEGVMKLLKPRLLPFLKGIIYEMGNTEPSNKIFTEIFSYTVVLRVELKESLEKLAWILLKKPFSQDAMGVLNKIVHALLSDPILVAEFKEYALMKG